MFSVLQKMGASEISEEPDRLYVRSFSRWNCRFWHFVPGKGGWGRALPVANERFAQVRPNDVLRPTLYSFTKCLRYSCTYSSHPFSRDIALNVPMPSR